MDHAVAALAVETKIRDAVRAGRLDKAPGDMLLDRAVEAGIIAEHQQVLDADEVRNEAIQVDAFDRLPLSKWLRIDETPTAFPQSKLPQLSGARRGDR